MRTRVLASAVIVAIVAAVVAGVLMLRGQASDVTQEGRISIDQALASFVQARFGTRYIGTCPQEFPPDGDIPTGMCSARFSGTSRRAVYGIGPPFSEWFGEATLVRDASGSWRVASFEPSPPLGANDPGTMPVTEFNTFLDEATPEWADSPARIALEFLHIGDPSEPDHGGTITVVQEAGAEGSDQVTVTVTREGLLDDSVQAIRHTLRFEKVTDGVWHIVSSTQAQRCAPGRGHQDFSTELCV